MSGPPPSRAKGQSRRQLAGRLAGRAGFRSTARAAQFLGLCRPIGVFAPQSGQSPPAKNPPAPPCRPATSVPMLRLFMFRSYRFPSLGRESRGWGGGGGQSGLGSRQSMGVKPCSPQRLARRLPAFADKSARQKDCVLADCRWS